MTFPAHLAAGLIIGKLTGDFTLAIVGAVVIDLDHVVSYFKHGVLFRPKKLFQAIKNQNDPWGDQRNFLHSIFAWLPISLIIIAIDLRVGIIISLAYLSHLILDFLDQADFYPFFPIKKLKFRGPVKYFSSQEIIFTAILFLLFFII